MVFSRKVSLMGHIEACATNDEKVLATLLIPCIFIVFTAVATRQVHDILRLPVRTTIHAVEARLFPQLLLHQLCRRLIGFLHSSTTVQWIRRQ